MDDIELLTNVADMDTLEWLAEQALTNNEGAAVLHYGLEADPGMITAVSDWRYVELKAKWGDDDECCHGTCCYRMTRRTDGRRVYLYLDDEVAGT